MFPLNLNEIGPWFVDCGFVTVGSKVITPSEIILFVVPTFLYVTSAKSAVPSKSSISLFKLIFLNSTGPPTFTSL